VKPGWFPQDRSSEPGLAFTPKVFQSCTKTDRDPSDCTGFRSAGAEKKIIMRTWIHTSVLIESLIIHVRPHRVSYNAVLDGSLRQRSTDGSSSAKGTSTLDGSSSAEKGEEVPSSLPAHLNHKRSQHTKIRPQPFRGQVKKQALSRSPP